MDCKLLTSAALAAVLTFSASPVSAQIASGTHGSAGISPDLVGVPPVQRGFGPCPDGLRHRMPRDRRFDCAVFVGGFPYADGEWALYNNRSWEPNSYNDWWHDRPDRAFPRWVQEQRTQGTCDPDRTWWSGSGWHC